MLASVGNFPQFSPPLQRVQQKLLGVSLFLQGRGDEKKVRDDKKTSAPRLTAPLAALQALLLLLLLPSLTPPAGPAGAGQPRDSSG